MTTKAKAISEPIARYYDFDDDVKEGICHAIGIIKTDTY